MLKPGMKMWDSAFQMPKGCHIYFQFAMLIRCQQIWTVPYAAKVKEERTYFLLYVKSIIIPQTHKASKIHCYTTSRIPYVHITIRSCFMTPGYTGWSKSLCAPDNYSTKNTQKYSIL